jgi:hypothetical protein
MKSLKDTMQDRTNALCHKQQSEAAVKAAASRVAHLRSSSGKPEALLQVRSTTHTELAMTCCQLPANVRTCCTDCCSVHVSGAYGQGLSREDMGEERGGGGACGAASSTWFSCDVVSEGGSHWPRLFFDMLLGVNITEGTQAQRKLNDAEAAARKAADEYELIQARMRDELVIFQTERSSDLTHALRNFALAQAKLAKQSATQWKGLVERMRPIVDQQTAQGA